MNKINGMTSSQKSVRSALFMSIGTMISRILGLVRDIIIAMFFSRTDTDAFFVAFRAPNFFRRFFGESALSVSFIPIFVQYLTDNAPNSKDQAKNFMNSVYTILLAVMGVLTVLGVVFMEPLLNILFSNTAFSAVSGKLEITLIMSRVLFVYLFLVTLYGYFMGIANALGYFFVPALAPAFLNVCIILCSFLPKSLVPFPPMLLCWGVLAGGIIQILLTSSLLVRLKFLPAITLRFSCKQLKMMLSRFLPGILGVGGFAIIGLLNLYFAAWLEEGTHTFIYYGDRLLELPRSLIAISFGTALLPNLSHLMAAGKKAELLNSSAEQRDILLFLILPCAAAFWFLGVPMIEVLFQRGYFDAAAVQKTAMVLKIYSVLLVTSSLCRVVAACFYSIKNTWYPALACLFYILFHGIVTPYMIHYWSLEGLIWATVLSNAFFLVLLLGAYPVFIGRLYSGRTFIRLLKSLPLLVILCLYLNHSFSFFSAMLNKILCENHAQTAALILVICSSIVFYIGGGAFMRLPQAAESLQVIKSKTKLNKGKA